MEWAVNGAVGPYVARCLSGFHYADSLSKVWFILLETQLDFTLLYQTFSVLKTLLKRALEILKAPKTSTFLLP